MEKNKIVPMIWLKHFSIGMLVFLNVRYFIKILWKWIFDYIVCIYIFYMYIHIYWYIKYAYILYIIVIVINMNIYACCVWKAFEKCMFLLNCKQTVCFYLNILIKSV